MYRICCFILPVSILLSLSSNLAGQDSKNPRSQFIEAESFFLFEEYKDALPLYQQISRVEPDNYNIIYKIGVCYLNNLYQKDKSIKYLKEASQHASALASPTSFHEKSAPLEAHFYLGKAYRINNQLDEAVSSFQRFKDLADPQVFDVELVNEEISACQRAKIKMTKPVYFVKKALPATINSRFAETNPVLSGDGRTLVFNRELQFYNGIFLSTREKSGNWSEPINLTPDFGLDGNSYITGISYKGDELFAYRSDDYDGNIYSSRFSGGKWSTLTKLDESINTKFWESHASLSPDGQYLYFTSNRSGGYGGLDIYKSKRGTNGQWGTAFNLGPVINSPENEETPFLNNDGSALFFSSLGHETMGGYDIFISFHNSDGTWEKPVNMGYPFCTTDDDLFYCPGASNSTGILSLYDPSSTQGLSDLYTVEVYNDLLPRNFLLKGKITLEGLDISEYGNISVKLIDPETHQLIRETKPENDGSYSIMVNQGNYKLVIEGDYINPYTSDISLSLDQADSLLNMQSISLSKKNAISQPVTIEKINKPQILAKKNIYIVNDSSAVSIDLKIPKGSNLKVDVLVDNKIIKTDHFNTVRENFTYNYKPKAGENILRFTSIDSKGDSSFTEVKVVYNPTVIPVEISSVTADTANEGRLSEILSNLSTGKLNRFIVSIDTMNYSNSYDLYKYLIDHAKDQGFTIDDVDKLFSLYYSQKNLIHFNTDFVNTIGYHDSAWLPILKSSGIPLQYVTRLSEKGSIQDSMMTKTLLKIITRGLAQDENLLTELNRYSLNKTGIENLTIRNKTTGELYKMFEKAVGVQNALHSLQLASTTENLEFYYQNLLFSSTGKLRNYLVGLQLKPNNIFTSIDLVNNLLHNAESIGYSAKDIIKALEDSKANKNNNLNQFIEMLSDNATGNLKSRLESIDLVKNNIHTYNDLLKYLLTQSQFKNITRESIYQLLIKMAGIEDVNEFTLKLMSFRNEAINKAIADTNVKAFATPFELLQYLLSSAGNYNFRESDINNMLLRMILEKGIINKGNENIEIKHKLWRNPNFITTIILVDVILIILIILFIARKKKKR